MKNPKYNKEIKPGVTVDVYDILAAWEVTNPALQHMIKKALQCGRRGHKSTEEDMDDILACAIRAKEIEKEYNNKNSSRLDEIKKYMEYDENDPDFRNKPLSDDHELL